MRSELAPPKHNPSIGILLNRHIEHFNLDSPAALRGELFTKMTGLGLSTQGDTPVNEALRIMEDAHKDQKRKFTMQEYAVHPLRVALLAIDIAEAMNVRVTDSLVVEALLHDTIEDNKKVTEYSLTKSFYRFGEDFAVRIGHDVESLNHFYQLDYMTKREKMTPEDYFDKIRNTDDPDTLLRRLIIKTADRTDNLLDPPLSPHNVLFSSDKLIETRSRLITPRTKEKFIPVLLEGQPFLAQVVDTAAQISEHSLRLHNFEAKNWQSYLIAA